MKHLWEIDHSYYCETNNYFARADEQHIAHFKSFANFLSEFGEADFDYNLLFRWDWVEGDDWGLPEYNNDDYYRNGNLLIFWMAQRKGLYFCSIIDVCRSDEKSVIEFLKPRWDHLRGLWEGIEDN